MKRECLLNDHKYPQIFDSPVRNRLKKPHISLASRVHIFLGTCTISCALFSSWFFVPEILAEILLVKLDLAGKAHKDLRAG
jgi:hypothetical protein